MNLKYSRVFLGLLLILGSVGGVIAQYEERAVLKNHQVAASMPYTQPLELKERVFFATPDQKFWYQAGMAIFISSFLLLLLGYFATRQYTKER